MKLIVAGATGFVAKEIIRQSLHNPKITSVLAVARRQVSPPPNLGERADTSKLHSVTLNDYGHWPDDVERQLAGADACIWTVTITPSKSLGMDFAEVRRVCQDCALTGLEATFEASHGGGGTRSQPFRFIYMSGSATEGDLSILPKSMADYCAMRIETEKQILAFAEEHKDAMEACVVKPGLITKSGLDARSIGAAALHYTTGTPKIDVGELSAAMLHEVIDGFGKQPIGNDDLVRIGREAMQAAG